MNWVTLARLAVLSPPQWNCSSATWRVLERVTADIAKRQNGSTVYTLTNYRQWGDWPREGDGGYIQRTTTSDNRHSSVSLTERAFSTSSNSFKQIPIQVTWRQQERLTDFQGNPSLATRRNGANGSENRFFPFFFSLTFFLLWNRFTVPRFLNLLKSSKKKTLKSEEDI